MLTRRVTWVHTGGYPFFFVWQQGASSSEEWNEAGFKRLMPHINKGGVTCWPPVSETEKIRLNTATEDQFMDGGFGDFYQAFWAWLGRPLKASDFKDYIVMPIHGGGTHYTSAVVAFAKPGQRFNPSNQYGFGAYVHIGTYQTYDYNKNPSQEPYTSDYWRGYVGAAAAVCADVNNFDVSDMQKADQYHNSAIYVRPVISQFDKDGDNWIIRVCFAVYGSLKTPPYDYEIDRVHVRVDNLPSGCRVKMVTDLSKSGKGGELELTGVYTSDAGLICETMLFFLALVPLNWISYPAIALGGIMLFNDWASRLRGVDPGDRGINRFDSCVDFDYQPDLNTTRCGDYYISEFESIIYIEVEVDASENSQWRIIPFDWKIELVIHGPGAFDVIARGSVSIATYYGYVPPFTTTVFFEDFENDMNGWVRGDSNPDSGEDYWGRVAYDACPNIFNWRTKVAWCALEGENSAGEPNKETGYYDNNMNAYLCRAVDLRPYRQAELHYGISNDIKPNDYLRVEYYADASWHLLKSYTDEWIGWRYDKSDTPLPNNTEYIRFRFISDGGGIGWGTCIDKIEIRGVVPNDANEMKDAGDDFDEATPISVSDSWTNYAGYLSDDDWYQFTVNDGQRIEVNLTYPPGADFDVELYDPYGEKKAGPADSITYTLSPSDPLGSWAIRIYIVSGFGQYDFDIKFSPQLMVETYLTPECGGGEITGVDVWVDDELVGQSPVTVTVIEGLHSVKVPSVFYRGRQPIRFKYEFKEWENGDTSNTRTLPVDHDMTIKAYYEVTVGCPTLFVWNGTDYVEEATLDIHGDSDVTVRHVLEHTPIAEDGFYLLSLRELDEFTSHIYLNMDRPLNHR